MVLSTRMLLSDEELLKLDASDEIMLLTNEIGPPTHPDGSPNTHPYVEVAQPLGLRRVVARAQLAKADGGNTLLTDEELLNLDAHEEVMLLRNEVGDSTDPENKHPYKHEYLGLAIRRVVSRAQLEKSHG